MLGLGLGLTRLGGRAPFSPSVIPDLVGWWDASDTSTITESGGAVSNWANKADASGLTDLVQATAAVQPDTGVATLNGLNVIRQAAGDDLRHSPGRFFPAGTYTFLFAVKGTADTTGALFAAAAGTYLGFYQDGSTSTILNNGVGTPETLVNGAASGTRDQLHTSLQSATIYEVAGATPPNAQWGTRYVSAYLNGAQDLAEILVYDRSLTADERTKARNYLAGKWGITL